MNLRITVKSRHTMTESLEKRHPDAKIIDVTSKAPHPWVKLSPYYPHGNIPIPFSPGMTAESVEGIWQGLKVFETAEIDRSVMQNGTMRHLKRSVRKYGQCRGHRKGIDGSELLGYLEARQEIYLPTYEYVLANFCQEELTALRELANTGPVVLLDFMTNGSINNLTQPLSHAHLIVRYLKSHPVLSHSWTARDGAFQFLHP